MNTYVTDTGEATDETSGRVEQVSETDEVTVAPKDAIDEDDSGKRADRDEATSGRDTGDVDGSVDDSGQGEPEERQPEPRELGRDLDAADDAQVRCQK